jgi:hypothetical protein
LVAGSSWGGKKIPGLASTQSACRTPRADDRGGDRGRGAADEYNAGAGIGLAGHAGSLRSWRDEGALSFGLDTQLAPGQLQQPFLGAPLVGGN